MPIDPFAVTSLFLAGGLAAAAFKITALSRRADFLSGLHKDEQSIASHYRNRVLLHEAAMAEAKRLRSDQSRKGGLARAAQQKAEAPARREKTITDLAATKFRTRAQVVAPVKAARTRKRNSGAGAAAMKGG